MQVNRNIDFKYSLAMPGENVPELIAAGMAMTPIGWVALAISSIGLCRFEPSASDSSDHAWQETFRRWGGPGIQRDDLVASTWANKIFTANERFSAHVHGTRFQLKVWQALLAIPEDSTTTYGAIATQIGHPHACRAVGTAVGRNPLALIIPCHRVVPASGGIGNYRWGIALKRKLLWIDGELAED